MFGDFDVRDFLLLDALLGSLWVLFVFGHRRSGVSASTCFMLLVMTLNESVLPHLPKASVKPDIPDAAHF